MSCKKNYPLVYLVCASFALTGCGAAKSSGAGPLKTITLIDRNGMTETINAPERIKQYRNVNFLNPQPYEKVLRIYGRTKTGDIPSYLHSYHENGLPKQYLEVVNSRACGIYKEWHANGCLKVTAYVIGGEADLSTNAEGSWVFDGTAFAWDEEGSLQAEISYQKGVLHGSSVYYHKNRNVWRVVPYCEGKLHGSLDVYLDDGQLFQRTSYVQGRLCGASKRLWNSQAVAVDEYYQDNALMEGKYTDRSGCVVSEVKNGNGFKALFGKSELAELHEFKNGLPEGKVKVFGTDGKELKEYCVKNNLKHGPEIEYYDIPHLRHLPKLLVTWYEGKIQGVTKTWYDNGVQESNREMSKNAKNGISTAWYRDGSLMLIEEYYEDKLTKGEYYRRGEKHPISTVKDGAGVATLFDPEGNFVNKILYEAGLPLGTG